MSRKIPWTPSEPVVETVKSRTAPAAGSRLMVVDGPPTIETVPVMVGSRETAGTDAVVTLYVQFAASRRVAGDRVGSGDRGGQCR